MSLEMVMDVLRDAFIRILLISAPVLLVGMLVGLVISIFQATTQIQEQTLSFVPKLIAVLLTLILTGNFMINILLEFTKYIFRLISSL
ncbi:MAG: flagellar biosynthesis protein FliQ [Liquorilactobacillus nagelii]|jgi:flagellar biosynthetic protein FliQ|uniref:Flagellar biosynthetic protein FliQ n=1 Tax=Liquorilactobacillus nagelii TaxID=82688 RepID=A0A3Q8CPZ6_9LACO|nr:flagellar biosynthesis protein FliQ [Liquorilactobacillus nagelii]AUJ33042.1 EscS/YscS/HrcS family type III secretion system export apparatus protein [Liquorilactobacillus nagelii]MCC7616648.1 flagellar biosynthetic protein FliQ [Liquorilactobacillus nagelii]MCI1700077.1 flagellar biosynthesis protein FliQ [Liquorilactobacillus nagelii]MCI1920789.1 flagellar biosynthesis protein FliQ [Liquorilactobacillus nagelii]MCI1976879.1 flagellar biosynthesis protein FliQ [Liquorilactobacillus nagelii